MTFIRIGVHLALSGLLFWLVNWLGPRSKAFGYVSLHAVPRAMDPPTTLFNVVFRSGSPVVFVLLSATALYAIGWDSLVQGIWLVPVYYFAGRLALNLFLGRELILNWIRELGQAGLSIALVAILYPRIIEDRDTLMPDPSAIVAELWIIVALFVYAVMNGVEFKSKGAIGRSDRYIREAFDRYLTKFGHIVSEEIPLGDDDCTSFVESVVYAVMIYEGFNRPPHIQRIERLAQRVRPGTPRTVGPMQVRSAIPMTDDESVREGVRRIVSVFEREGWCSSDERPYMYDVAYVVYRDYNPDDDYIEDVSNVHATLLREKYPKLAPSTDDIDKVM